MIATTTDVPLDTLEQELIACEALVSRARSRQAELLRILDGELRLITPADPEEFEFDEVPASEVAPEGRFYQLTHDYLVPALRGWLTRKQKETRRGRAEIRLADRAALWNVKPENRHLPYVWEWLNIRLLTRKRDWTLPQRKMLRRAGRYYAMRGVLLAACVALAGLGAYQVHGRFRR